MLAMSKTKVTRDLTDSNVQTPSHRITSTLETAKHLRATFCTPQWSQNHKKNMKINKVVVMYLDTGEIVRPFAPPDVSVVKGILSSFSFRFCDTPGHYVMRKYSCWCKVCVLVRGCCHGCVSRGRFLDVSACLSSKLTVWKEDQFTVLPGPGIKNREARVSEWVTKVLSLVNPGVWGCLQVRTQWSTEEDTHMRPGHHWLCEFGKTLLSSSRGGSTEWRRMCQDSRSKSGCRTLTHHGHLWLC
jgi:hypothetical protein